MVRNIDFALSVRNVRSVLLSGNVKQHILFYQLPTYPDLFIFNQKYLSNLPLFGIDEID